ncbi:MAG: HAMP domain-containing protein [Spirochaetaceae bacterium]|nr:MAG: HAMP domain-containing protein [Spirochaetaceae bacterium]
MRIRLKVVLVVLPIVVVAVAMVGLSSFLSATTGITRIAHEFLDFKTLELERHALSQWQLLLDNELADVPEMVEATKFGVESYARGMLRSETEAVYAFDPHAELVMATGQVDLLAGERDALRQLVESRTTELVTPALGGVQRVAKGFYFAPYDWYILHSEHYDVFYRDVRRITYQTVVILALSIVLSVLFLVLFAGTLTRPLRSVVTSMRRIIASNDLSERVPVQYRDETGELAHTFNIMTEELDRAYAQIKSYALQAVVARKKETKIRNIFQKYVPQELIDRFFENPESMLVGENRVLSVLFSDIRSFTSISEAMNPDDLVQALNNYFSVMVDIIMSHNGIIDKYIGDAIMAFFGAPVKREDDAYHSVVAGLEMCRGLESFNRQQRAAGRPEFQIGVGINYGVVTVGNIGTDKKMDYTVIGDMVNLASRLEGLTKHYRVPILISQSLQQRIDGRLPTRLLDMVAVKGKAFGARIYTAALELDQTQRRVWERHNEAMELYLKADFTAASEILTEVLHIAPQDEAARRILDRAERYSNKPPPSGWQGVEVMESK